MVKCLEEKVYEEQLNSLDLFSQKEREDLIMTFSILRRRSRGAGTDLLSGDGTQRNGMGLHQGRFRLDIKKRFFTRRQWAQNRLPREVSQPQDARVQGAFGQCSQIYCLIFGWSCGEPGVGFNDPRGSLPT